MSQTNNSTRRQRIARRIALFVIPALLAGLVTMVQAGGGPMDLPKSLEPRVEAGKCLSAPGLISSEGNFLPYFRIGKGDTIHTRDLLVALPGFEIKLVPAGKNVSR